MRVHALLALSVLSGAAASCASGGDRPVPPQGFGAAVTDDQLGQLVMLAGSLDGFNRPKETTTWTWDGHDWVRLGVGSEPSR